MKADLTTQHYPVRETLPDLRRLAEPLENLDAARYNRRTWRRRLPAVLAASLLIALLLLGSGISLVSNPWLVLIPLVCLPLAAAVALSSA